HVQSEEAFFGGLPAPQLTAVMSEYAKMAQRLSAMAGEPNARDAKLADLRVFQLPLFQAMAEMPHIKGLTASGPLGALGILNQPAKLAEIFGAVTQAIPDGTFFMLQGVFLQQTGRLSEAEAVLRRAVASPSWANHRRAARFHLAQTQWLLANSRQTPTKEQPSWKEKALANVRHLASSGSQPLEPTVALVNIAYGCGDPVLGLALTESALRAKPDNRVRLGGKLDREIVLNTLNRAEATAKAYTAALEVKGAQRPVRWDPLVNLARAYHNAGRPADALRWCDWLH